MRTEVTTRVTINAPPEIVFKYLAHLKYHPLWNPHALHISPRIKIKNGSVYHTERLFFGAKIQVANKVIGYEQDKSLSISYDAGLMVYNVYYTLRKQKGSTVLTRKIAVSIESPAFAFAEPIMKPLIQQELQPDLRLLKMVVEQGVEI